MHQIFFLPSSSYNSFKKVWLDEQNIYMGHTHLVLPAKQYLLFITFI